MEPTRDLVGAVVELTPRMEYGQHNFEGGPVLGGMHVCGNPASVVGDGDRVVGMHGNLDLGAEARHHLVDGVVYYLPYQVMEARRRRGANVHRRPHAYGLKALQDLDLAPVVAFVARSHGLPLSHPIT